LLRDKPTGAGVGVDVGFGVFVGAAVLVGPVCPWFSSGDCCVDVEVVPQANDVSNKTEITSKTIHFLITGRVFICNLSSI